MKVAVYGTGAVGGYFGGRLAEAGHDVVFIARGAHLAALRSSGLRVDSVAGDFRVDAGEATDDPARVGPVEVVLVGVKAWQVPEVAAALRPLVGPRTTVVPLQNGVEAADQLAAVLGRDRILGGLCRIMSSLAGPGHIRHGGVSPTIEIGELGGEKSERLEALRRAFAGARGLTVSVRDDIEAALWEKFIFIACFGGVGAVTRVPAGALRRVPETRALLVRAMEEIFVVARARGVRLGDDAVARALEYVDALPEDATASMQRDIAEGRPSELESMSGTVVRLGRAAGVETPAHAFLHAALLPLEGQARKPR